MTRPLVSCICPTYGRATLLGDALACFLAQTYTPRELIIINDAPIAFRHIEAEAPAGTRIRIANAPDIYDSLGDKYRALVALAGGDIIAHWEDDDLYMPWHLAHLVPRVRGDIDCVKAQFAWCLKRLPDGRWGVEYNTNPYEASMVYRKAALTGDTDYGDDSIEQSFHLLQQFGKAGHLGDPQPPPMSYAFRLGASPLHGEWAANLEAWRAANTDFSPVLTPGDVKPWYELLYSAAPTVVPDHAARFRKMMEPHLSNGG